MTRWVVLAGLVVVGLLIWAAVVGFTAGAELLLTAAVLVLLIGGGNLLGGGHRHAPKDPPE